MGLLLVGVTKSEIYTKKSSGWVQPVMCVTEIYFKNFQGVELAKSVKFAAFMKNVLSGENLTK